MTNDSPATDNLVEQTALAVAERLVPQHGPSLQTDVYAALHARDTQQRPTQYFDPVTLGSLIVSVTSLAWTIYRDLRAKKANSSKELIARRIRLELPPTPNTTTEQRDQIIDIVIEDIATQDGRDPNPEKRPDDDQSR
jgi:hypothetical protein